MAAEAEWAEMAGSLIPITATQPEAVGADLVMVQTAARAAVVEMMPVPEHSS